jgi:small GTP-binding protein
MFIDLFACRHPWLSIIAKFILSMKIVLLGNSQVGKTCLLSRLVTGRFSETLPTIGAAFQTHMLATPTGSVTLQIWDTAGQEQYRALSPMYYRSAQVAIVCYDITSVPSFEAMPAWLTELTNRAGKTLRIIVAATKADLLNERTVPERDARDLALSKGASAYIECSAKSGDGILELFSTAAQLINDGGWSLPHSDMEEVPTEAERKECC